MSVYSTIGRTIGPLVLRVQYPGSRRINLESVGAYTGCIDNCFNDVHVWIIELFIAIYFDFFVCS